MIPLDHLRKARFWQIAGAPFAGLLFAATALACEVPRTEGSMPLRRVVTRVKYLPETEAWQKSLPQGVIVQFVLLVDSPERIRGRCYWPVEVRASGALWKRFLVAADGRVLGR